MNKQYQKLGIIETLLLATKQRPWLWGVYVFTVGLPIILFISFMWPDKRFGPPDQQYYYKKSDDAQPDDPEFSMRIESVENKGKADRATTRRRDTHGNQRKSDLDLKAKQAAALEGGPGGKNSGLGGVRVLEGLWEFAQPVHMCLALWNLEKAFDRVPREYSVGGALESGLGTTGFHLCFFADDAVLLASSNQDLQHLLEWFAAECEGGWDENQHLQVRVHGFSTGKGWLACLLWVGGEVLPQVEEFKYLGVLFTSEGRWSVRLTGQADWCSLRSYAVGMLDHHGEEGAESKSAKLSIYLASNSCREEVARLQEQEKLLKGQLWKQELLLHKLQLLNQPGTKDKHSANQSQDTQYTDCSQLFSSGSKSSGFYNIKPHGSPSPIRVYCDMSDGGGWIVIQRRINGTEKFNRVLARNEMTNLHYITTQGNYSLRINLEDFDGKERYAEYKNFKVANKKDHYKLSFGTYVGTAGDALSGGYQVGESEWASHQGIKFSTYDQDNDNYSGNCAQEDKGGWWFNKCHSAHLNGLYYPNGHYSALTDDGIVWYTWRGWWYSLKTSIMKVRPTDFKMDPIDDPNAVHSRPPS
ncbi:hypothetical protein L3Q82_020845 [Scortum barcoo]|uniref:Uncharacterized protein n=1 Tax=Scortum barcoo TaxID=214431 RepID=A0ACB8V9W8_9TELE|nr:hypothetical protein L3Q82_020845 [Scortum barcoo]